MLGKILFTLLVIGIFWLSIRHRWRTATTGQTEAERPPLIPPAVMRAVAYGLLAILIVGSGLYLFQDWEQRHRVIEIQVVNPSTGAVQSYQVRRGDIDGRRFRTLDGREVRIAEMERMILIE